MWGSLFSWHFYSLVLFEPRDERKKTKKQQRAFEKIFCSLISNKNRIWLELKPKTFSKHQIFWFLAKVSEKPFVLLFREASEQKIQILFSCIINCFYKKGISIGFCSRNDETKRNVHWHMLPSVLYTYIASDSRCLPLKPRARESATRNISRTKLSLADER